jgi:hypothetical protein
MAEISTKTSLPSIQPARGLFDQKLGSMAFCFRPKRFFQSHISGFWSFRFQLSQFLLSGFQLFRILVFQLFPADTSCRSIRRRISAWPTIYVLPVEG